MFDHLSGNKNESNMDDTYPSSLVETRRQQKKKDVSLKEEETQTHS